MWGSLLLLVLTTAASISALPCCAPGTTNDLTYVNSTVFCPNRTFALAYKYCAEFFVIGINNHDDDEEFYEKDNRSLYSQDGIDWYPEYCTGILKEIKDIDEHNVLLNLTGKEVALICSWEEEKPEDLLHYTLYGVCLFISCVFLLATLIIYLLLPELQDLQGKCVLSLVLSLMLGYLGLSFLQLPFTSPDVEDNMCIAAAFLTYYWMLSAFFWLNINSFNMWRSTVLAHVNVTEKKLMLAYYLAGWGIPLLFLAFALITHHMPGEGHIKPHFGEESCWFKGKLEQWIFFYGAALVLIVLNTIYFISTAAFLWSDYRSPNPRPRIKSLRFKFCLYFKLFLVMGVTWIFEILSSIANEPWYVTDVLNCLQGVIIFIVMIACRKRVWRLLVSKKICGGCRRFAHCWDRMEDEEETENDPMEDTQMSINNDK